MAKEYGYRKSGMWKEGSARKVIGSLWIRDGIIILDGEGCINVL